MRTQKQHDALECIYLRTERISLDESCASNIFFEESASCKACGICNETLTDGDLVYTSMCDHVFHFSCFMGNDANVKKCPGCQADPTFQPQKQPNYPNRHLNAKIDKRTCVFSVENTENEGKEETPPECLLCDVAFEGGDLIFESDCNHMFHTSCFAIRGLPDCPKCEKETVEPPTKEESPGQRFERNRIKIFQWLDKPRYSPGILALILIFLMCSIFCMLIPLCGEVMMRFGHLEQENAYLKQKLTIAESNLQKNLEQSDNYDPAELLYSSVEGFWFVVVDFLVDYYMQIIAVLCMLSPWIYIIHQKIIRGPV